MHCTIKCILGVVVIVHSITKTVKRKINYKRGTKQNDQSMTQFSPAILFQYNMDISFIYKKKNKKIRTLTI